MYPFKNCFFQGKKWFGDDGRIMALPDPIKESSTRPPLFQMEEDVDPALHTVYRKVRHTPALTLTSITPFICHIWSSVHVRTLKVLWLRQTWVFSHHSAILKKKQKGSLAFGTKEQKGRRRLLSGNRKQVEADTSVYSTATSKIQLVIVGDVNSPFEIELELLIDFFF